MIYKIIHNESEMKKALSRNESKSYGYAYVTDIALARELYHEVYPYNDTIKVLEKPSKELRVKTDKVSICLGWWLDIRHKDNGEAYVSDIHTTPEYIVTYKDVMFTPTWYKKPAPTWHILNDAANYEYMPYNERYESEGKPNGMGTITEKGMEEWYQYLMKRRDKALSLESQKKDAWGIFLKRVQAIADKYGMENDCTKRNKYGTFYLDKERRNGWLSVNAIQISFSCDSGGHISQKVTLASDFVLASEKSKGDTLDRFMRVANNDWSK